MKAIPGKTWLAKPKEINSKIIEWKKNFPDKHKFNTPAAREIRASRIV